MTSWSDKTWYVVVIKVISFILLVGGIYFLFVACTQFTLDDVLKSRITVGSLGIAIVMASLTSLSQANNKKKMKDIDTKLDTLLQGKSLVGAKPKPNATLDKAIELLSIIERMSK
jgi:hypothetical protein